MGSREGTVWGGSQAQALLVSCGRPRKRVEEFCSQQLPPTGAYLHPSLGSVSLARQCSN